MAAYIKAMSAARGLVIGASARGDPSSATRPITTVVDAMRAAPAKAAARLRRSRLDGDLWA
jgi:hypothetical protein